MFSASKTSSQGASGYQINNSLRVGTTTGGASDPYLSRTVATSGNRKIWTVNFWNKRSFFPGSNSNFVHETNFDVNNRTNINFFGGGGIRINETVSGVATSVAITSPVYLDPASWYMVTIAVDTTQANANDRVAIYVNGVRVTDFVTFNGYSQNQDTNFNSNGILKSFIVGPAAEINIIDGQALPASAFGQYVPGTNQWVAKKYTGTYGANGAYYSFSNGTSTTTLGADSSGNGNNFTLNGFTRSPGIDDCWFVDVPSGNGGSTGQRPNSNYATFNPYDGLQYGSIIPAYTNSWLTATGGASTSNGVSTIALEDGKWYCEFTVGTISAPIWVGCQDINGFTGNGSAYNSNGEVYCNGVLQGTYATFTNGDVIGCAFDLTNNEVSFYKNNVQQGTTGTLGSVNKTYFVWTQINASGNVVHANFGQRSFAYTPPSGFKTLCTANLPTPTILNGNEHMNATLYTGTGSTQSLTNEAGFQPGLVWIKSRSTSTDNALFDQIRGPLNLLTSNSTAAEANVSSSLLNFNPAGFSVGTNTTVNNSGTSYVAWQWQAWPTGFVVNSLGTISSNVSANPAAGISVVTYTGNGSNPATIGHGLGVAPRMIITKNRVNGSATWVTLHQSANGGAGQNGYLNLNTTAAWASDVNAWNNTAPTSSVFTVGSYSNASTNTYVAYCFSQIAGFSRFGSYTGNGSADGPFVYLGFRPKYVMIKNITTSGYGGWLILDTSRNPYNVTDKGLAADISNAEFTIAYAYLLSNGFKIKIVDNAVNASSNSYIYMAFAESPFANSNSR